LWAKIPVYILIACKVHSVEILHLRYYVSFRSIITMVYDMIVDFTPIFLGFIIVFALGHYIGYNVCKALSTR